jgi:Na+/H+-dicarboxylate symporter
MTMIIKDYTLILAIIALALFGYILLAYFLLSNGRAGEFLQSLKNMLPAAVSGFSTMSSAASMPLTIIGAENNAKNKDLVGSVIPATVNIHLIGDCFAIPIFAYAVLKNYGMPDPTLMSYLIFTCYFVLAKFSVAAIPGGGIIVMLPILEAYLGFNADMMSLITALYILFDPVITCANVLGNGAFAKLMDRVLSRDRKMLRN